MRSLPTATGRPSGGGAAGRWSFLDIVFGAFLSAVLIFLTLVFSPLGDPLAASGRRALARPLSPSSSPPDRAAIITLLDSADVSSLAVVPPCPAEEVDLMPCEDPRRSSQLSRFMNLYRERHCPKPGEAPLCLVPPPDGYRVPVPWPESLHKIWHDNMPYNKIAERKGHQGWMRKQGLYFIFPGGGTMFPDGAEEYIEKLGQYIPIKDGVLRTALDMGCGVASFGGFLLKKEILTLSFAPRDSHKSQIQFALERGIPSFVAMLGTRRLPFPAYAFDLVHCSRCLIPFTAYNGTYLTEADRLLRPGGYLVISGPPVRWTGQEKEWAALQDLALALCYELVVVDGNTAIWKKPLDVACSPKENGFGIEACSRNENPSEAWYFKMKSCVSKVAEMGDLAVGYVPKWPDRLSKLPARASAMKSGLGLFEADTELWAKRVGYYKKSLGLKLGSPLVRNVMDMNAALGGFAAAIVSDPVWVMNVVPSQGPLTLDVIYDRGLVGVYHDWCEPFSTYPRTYDLIHAAKFSNLVVDPISGKRRCHIIDLMVEIDRILRPEGTVIIRDSPEVVEKVRRASHAVRWTAKVHHAEPECHGSENILVAKKNLWKLPSASH